MTRRITSADLDRIERRIAPPPEADGDGVRLLLIRARFKQIASRMEGRYDPADVKAEGERRLAAVRAALAESPDDESLLLQLALLKRCV